MRLVIACLFVVGCGRLSFDDSNVDATRVDAPEDPPRVMELGPMSFSTTSTSFVDVPGATLTIPPSPGQKWLLLVSGLLSSSTLVYNGPEAQYLVDGVVRGLGGTENVTAGRSGPWQHFDAFAGSDVPRTITFQLRDALGGTSQLDDLRVIAVPVPPENDLLFDGSNGPKAVRASVDAATLTIDPASGGDYVILLVANTTESPGTSDIDWAWLDPSRAVVGRPYKNPRGAWQSALIIRRMTLGPDPVQFVLQAASGGAEDAQVAYARVAALRVDPATRFGFVFQDTDLSTTAPVQATMLAPALDAASSYVMVGTARVDDDCGNAQLAERDIVFEVDGAARYHVTHAAGNCAYETTYGFVDVQSQRPTSMDVTFSSPNAQIVVHRESALVVVGIP